MSVKNILKYHNDLNKYNFNLSEKELNLIFCIFFYLQEEKDTIHIDLYILKKLSIADTHNFRFFNSLSNIQKNFLGELFEIFQINKDSNSLEVKLLSEKKYLFNDLKNTFTKFDLNEFLILKSKYSKNIYRLLKQWDSKKEKIFTLDDFKKILNIPNSYRISELDRFIIKKSFLELEAFFYNLKTDKVKIGTKVVKIKFYWETKQIPLRKNIEIIEISEELNRVLKKAKKNKFISELLIPQKLKVLLKLFSEEEIITGLIFAKNEVKHEIQSLNYLIKTIQTANEQPKIEIIVKKTTQIQNSSPTQLLKKSITVVSKEEYENLYQYYLEKNDIDDLKSTRLAFDMMNKEKYKIK